MGKRNKITEGDRERFHVKNRAKVLGALSRYPYPMTAYGIMEDAGLPIQYLWKAIRDLLTLGKIEAAGEVLGHETYRRKT